VVERWFSTGVFPPMQRALTPISNLVPFAILDVLSVGALIAAVITIVRGVRAARRARRLAPVLRTAGHLVAAVACG